MKRQHQFVLIAATLAFSWLGMQAVHELGHVAGAVLSGGRVEEVVLHPARISQTRLAANPHPLLVVWMGPLVGIGLPMAVLAWARWRKPPGWPAVQFFTGFCFVANGAYIAAGSFGGIGDAGDMLRHGAPMWLLWTFGLVTIPIGLWMWNGLGGYFGLGDRRDEASPAAAYVMLGLVVVAIGLELLFAGRHSSTLEGSGRDGTTSKTGRSQTGHEIRTPAQENGAAQGAPQAADAARAQER